MLARRWQLRASARQRRGAEAPSFGPTLEGRNSTLECARGCDVEATRMGAIVLGERRPYICWNPHPRLSEVVGASWTSRGLTSSSLIEKEQAAAAYFALGGGLAGERRRKIERERRRVAMEATRVARFRAQVSGPQLPGSLSRGCAVVGLSGRRLRPVHDAVAIEIAPRRGGAKKARAAPSHSIHGAGADRWGRWPYERVLEVTRPRTRGGQVQVRIRWAGLDPRNGLPWRDSWVDLAWGGTEAFRQECQEMLRVKYGEVQQPLRRAATTSADRTLDARPATARFGGLRVSLRSGTRAARPDAEDAVVNSATRGILDRQRRRIREDDASDRRDDMERPDKRRRFASGWGLRKLAEVAVQRERWASFVADTKKRSRDGDSVARRD